MLRSLINVKLQFKTRELWNLWTDETYSLVQSLMNHGYTQAHEGCSDPSFVGVTTCEFCHADEGGICFRIADKNYLQRKSATQEAML